MKTKPGYLSCLAVALAFALVSCTPNDGLSVSEAWVPPTVSGQTVGAAYMQLRSARNAELVKVETDVASMVEIHQMSFENNLMKMRRLDTLELPAGEVVNLEPGGRHLMLLDLQRPLNAGDTVRLTLTLSLGQGRYAKEQVVVNVVRKRAPEAGK